MKKLSLLAFVLIAALLLVACGTPAGTFPSPADSTPPPADTQTPTDPPAETESVSLTILMAKPEVSAQFEEVLAAYNAKTGNNATMIPLPAGQEVYEKMTSLYASGNAPSISMVGQEFSEFQGKFLDISDAEFVKRAGKGTLDFVTVDGKVYGTPSTVEAYGIIYNPKLAAEVLGADYDPTQIKTINEFKEFLDKLKTAGKGAFTLSPMDWSLGAHLSNTVYAGQSDNRDARHKFVADLKAGAVTLGDNAVFNGWMDTFDLLLEITFTPILPSPRCTRTALLT